MIAAVAQQLSQFSASLLEDPRTLALALIFAAVLFIVIAIGSLVTSSDRAQRRLSGGVAVVGGSTRHSIEQSSTWNESLAALEKRIGSMSRAERSKLRHRMMQAGYFSTNAVRIYYFLRLALAVSLPVIFLLMAPFLSRDISAARILIIAAMISLSGLYLPSLWVTQRIARMQRTITESFPDALDMLTVCVEAGLGLDAAFTRVGTQIGRAHAALASQFALVALELRAGKSREDALRNLARRVGVPEISSFVTLLVQSEALGTSVGHTLRVYSDEMRVKRTLRAEEMAHKLPVKLSVILVLFILPALVTVIMLPGIINIVRVLFPVLGS